MRSFKSIQDFTHELMQLEVARRLDTLIKNQAGLSPNLSCIKTLRLNNYFFRQEMRGYGTFYFDAGLVSQFTNSYPTRRKDSNFLKKRSNLIANLIPSSVQPTFNCLNCNSQLVGYFWSTKTFDVSKQNDLAINWF